jgi:hypothetical protein
MFVAMESHYVAIVPALPVFRLLLLQQQRRLVLLLQLPPSSYFS